MNKVAFLFMKQQYYYDDVCIQMFNIRNSVSQMHSDAFPVCLYICIDR